MDDSDLARVPGQSPLDGAWSQSGGWAEVAILSDGEGDPVVGDQVVGEAAGDGAGQGVESRRCVVVHSSLHNQSD